MPASHVQVQPDSTGKDVDADAVTSTESGTPTVYRQDMVVADPVTYASKGRVFAAGQARTAHDPGQLFFDTFDTSLDTVNRWATPVASGTGAVAAAWSAGVITLTGGTASNAYSELHSQPVFIADEPAWDLYTFRLNIEFPVLTTGYRFWGIGQTTSAPTIAAPLTDACGWETATTGKLYAVTYISGTRTVIADLSSSGNGKQPGDALNHKYLLYFRPDQSYWAIDDPDNVVASYLTGSSGPNVNALPIKLLAVSNSGTACTLVVDAVSVADSASNHGQIADATYPWRQATVTATGSLKVAGEAPASSSLTNVSAATSSTTLLSANAARKQAMVMNDSTANLYLGLTSSAVSVTSYTVKVAAGGFYEVPWPVWTGQVTGIWDAAAGTARITELS